MIMQKSGESHYIYVYVYRVPCHSGDNSAQISHSKNADWCLGLDWSSWHYPCLSPLSVLGVAFSTTARAQASIFQAAVRCLRLEGLPETQHSSLPSSSLCFTPLPSCLLTPPRPSLPFRYEAQLLSLCTVTITIYSQQLAL